MVSLHHRPLSRKRPSSSAFISPLSSSKLPKSSTTAAAPPPITAPEPCPRTEPEATHAMASVLADAGCTLINPSGPPCLPSDHHKFRHHLHRLFSDSSLRSQFLSAFSVYIASPRNLHRVLIPSSGASLKSRTSSQGASLVRNLLLVPSVQLDLQIMLLEKLPEYFNVSPDCFGATPFLNDIATLILSHFRWLDFLVDANTFTVKLLEVLSISPPHLKKEIIGSLPEILGDQNNKAVVDALEQLLQEDSAITVPIVDALSNLNLDDQLQEQVITIAISCIRTIDAEQMPYLLRFLLLSATSKNARRIISRIREQLKNFRAANSHKNKLKGKSLADSSEASILETLRSSLRYKNILSEETLKELKSLENPLDHKVIDIWLLILIYLNGGSLQKTVEKIFRKKVIDGCIQECLFDLCVQGNEPLVQEYFPALLSLSAYLLACKEEKAREFAIHMYVRLFEELVDTYSRQEVIGALITHVGSGVNLEVSSALEAMILLVSKYSQEMVRLNSHVNGILDFLEGFSFGNLHKVYEVFSYLALWARATADSVGSNAANEVFMILRKQICNPDIKYKKMGLIGTLKIVSCFGDVKNATSLPTYQKSNSDEALELLEACLECCKQLPILMIMFYDELVYVLESRTLHPSMLEWIGKNVGEFESMFLSDIEGGQLPTKDSYYGLEGELWMNLDSDISPICLSILPLASSSTQSASSIDILPANFLLLSAIESVANQGSLGGIDALLGCPLHLPSSKFCSGSGWKVLTTKQKQIVCLSIYYAANWTRELLNAFSTQVMCQYTTQASKDEISIKLLKRLRNLVFLESLLNYLLKDSPLCLPELHLHARPSGSSTPDQLHFVGSLGKRTEFKEIQGNKNSNIKKKHTKVSESSNSDANGKYKQATLLDMFKKAGSDASQDVPNEGYCSVPFSNDRIAEPAASHSCDPSSVSSVEVSEVPKILDAQKFKFRPLSADCSIILTFSKETNTCCPDPTAELPLYLYLLRDMRCKLEVVASTSTQCAARCFSTSQGLTKMTQIELLRKFALVFPSLRKHLNAAVHFFKEGAETCDEHWKAQSICAGNPDIPELKMSTSSVSFSICMEILCCFSKMLNIPDLLVNKSILSGLLEAFQLEIPLDFFLGIQSVPNPGSMDYLYCSAYYFLEEIMDLASSHSFAMASEVLVSLESLVISGQKFFEKLQDENDNKCTKFIQEVLPVLHDRLGNSAQKLLLLDCSDNPKNSLKSKGETVQKILRINLKYKRSASSTDLLDELACSILPQVLSHRSTPKDANIEIPTLSSATFVIWYRSLHEENLATLSKLVKEVLHNLKMGVQDENERVLFKLQKSVNVVVALLNMCRTHNKVAVHAMAVKYCGKFLDTFLKVFGFLQKNFGRHNDLIVQLVKDLQKATRTVQCICSDAKGSRQMVIIRKVPGTKRSMERFLFHVKALLHTSSSGCTFWMGNLKHKDLMGQVVSSQAYVDEAVSDDNDPSGEAGLEDESVALGADG